jgi:hypothetical protein
VAIQDVRQPVAARDGVQSVPFVVLDEGFQVVTAMQIGDDAFLAGRDARHVSARHGIIPLESF